MDALETALDARLDQQTMSDRVRELEAELLKFENWETEKQWYELKEVGSGKFVYALKELVETSEPPHMICPNCHQNRVQFRYCVGFRSSDFEIQAGIDT